MIPLQILFVSQFMAEMKLPKMINTPSQAEFHGPPIAEAAGGSQDILDEDDCRSMGAIVE